MATRTFNGRNVKIKLDIQMDAISKNLSEHQVIALSFNKAVKETFVQEAIGKKIIQKLKKLIREGGTTKYGWGWWERRKGELHFKYMHGKSFQFSKGWSYGKSGTGDRLIYPVHPKTFVKRRRARKKPKPGQYALWDTGTLLQGIYFVNTKLKYGLIYQMITNAHLRNAEYGVNQPPRKVMQPVYEDVMNMNKSNIEKSIISKMEKDFNQMNKGL